MLGDKVAVLVGNNVDVAGITAVHVGKLVAAGTLVKVTVGSSVGCAVDVLLSSPQPKAPSTRTIASSKLSKFCILLMNNLLHQSQ